MTETKTKVRITVLGALIAFLFVSLSMRLWFLQVLATEQYAERAKNNQTRILPREAPRGRILDREGRALVKNRSSTIVYVDRSKLKGAERDLVLRELADILGVKVASLRKPLEDDKYYAFQPVPVAFDVREEAAMYLLEHQRRFPGIDVRIGPVREYPFKAIAAHLLGYTGEISAEELEAPRFEGYAQGDLVGKAGVERVYERDLQGKKGLRNFEVNAQGKVLRSLGERPPVPGSDLRLSIDLDAQRVAEESLFRGIELARNLTDEDSGEYLNAGAGAALVMDPRDGRILAMASYPTFNPSQFVGGIKESDLKRLTARETNFPLLNRAAQSAYPPGSTFKPFVAAAALKEGLASEAAFYPCPAEYGPLKDDPSETTFKNWKSVDSGHIDLREALVQSCDTVFYDFGYKFYLKRGRDNPANEIFLERLRDFGFGRITGIDQPSEEDGRIPDVEWVLEEAKRNPNFANRTGWLPGDDINMSIGQGNVQSSPLQLAVAFSALANGGTLYAPRLGLRIERPDGEIVREIDPKIMGNLPYSPRRLKYIRESLVGVVTAETGTAAGAFAGFPHSTIPVAGKTGTSEMDPLQPFSWFAAMAPAYAPKYVVVAVIEEGGHGSTTAAPVVRRILEGLFGIEPAELQSGGTTD